MEQNLFINTPLFKSSKRNTLFYKMECYQPTGSFKPRGMENMVRHFLKEGKNKFITSSGGNAGYGLAYVCQNLNSELKVIVPKTTSEFMIDKIEALNTIVEVVGNNWNEADDYAKMAALTSEMVYIHPFDHPKLWEGYSKIISECAQQMERPDKIVLSVGGGGLLCGLLEGMKNNNWEDIQVITAETKGAASFYESYLAGKVVTLDKVNSIATSISSKRVSEEAFNRSQNFNIEPHIVSDQDTLDACQNFFNQYNVLVEPACGAALSVANKLNKTSQGEKILVIVCGGSGFSFQQFLNYIQKFTV